RRHTRSKRDWSSDVCSSDLLNSDRTMKRKANEALMAVLLELHYSKDEILQTYLNEIYLGQNGNRSINGFGLASQFYFDKPLKERSEERRVGKECRHRILMIY